MSRFIQASVLLLALLLAARTLAHGRRGICQRTRQGNHGAKWPSLLSQRDQPGKLASYPEGYMFDFSKAKAPWQIQQIIKELLGTEANNAFWRQWRDTFITADDIRYIRSTGMNMVRIPFDFRLFTPEDYPRNLVKSRVRPAGQIVDWSARAHLYVLLDMHAAPCGQTGTNIDNSYGYPRLYEDSACRARTAQIWRHIARPLRSQSAMLSATISLTSPYRTMTIIFTSIKSSSLSIRKLLRPSDRWTRTTSYFYLALNGAIILMSFTISNLIPNSSIHSTSIGRNRMSRAFSQHLNFASTHNVPDLFR